MVPSLSVSSPLRMEVLPVIQRWYRRAHVQLHVCTLTRPVLFFLQNSRSFLLRDTRKRHSVHADAITQMQPIISVAHVHNPVSSEHGEG